MFLDPFFSMEEGLVRIRADQASRFAKEVAGDYNPIHDPGAKRFCVPGDLLFCLVLARYGLSQRMRFSFKGMVGDDVGLRFPEHAGASLEISDDAGKTYLEVEREGETSTQPELVESLSRQYVAFSGQNFPHILAPLMAEHKVMLNLERPLVIYESMSLELEHLNFAEPVVDLAEATLDVNGKRGDARLLFRISSGEREVGRGSKKLVLSGLREFDGDVLEQFVSEYQRRVESVGL